MGRYDLFRSADKTILSSQDDRLTGAANLFRQTVYWVWAIILFYSVFYFAIGAYFSAAAVAIGVFVFTPLVLLLEKYSHARTSRLLFLFSCNFYIYASSLGLGHVVNIEYYFVPAMMLSLLTNDLEDHSAIFFGGLLPIASWIIIKTFGTLPLPTNFIFVPVDKSTFSTLNFFGAFSLSFIFLMILIRTIKSQRMKMIASAKMSSLGEMAGGIAHEINNPLAIISGRASHLLFYLKKAEEIDREKISDDLVKIEATVERIAKIIKGLRAFSRDSEKDPMANVPVKELIDETLELCGEKIKNLGIRFHVKCPGNLEILCRRTQISQVIMNLVNNGVDAVQPLPEKWIAVEAVEHNGGVIISVTDSGNGIPEPILGKIMQPFFTTKEVGRGTGLGLSISKGIVEDHGGTLRYDESSTHTRFLIALSASPSVTDEAA